MSRDTGPGYTPADIARMFNEWRPDPEQMKRLHEVYERGRRVLDGDGGTVLSGPIPGPGGRYP